MIFADTSFWVALRNSKDPRHPEASKLLRSVADQTLVTSNHVRGETWTILRRRAGHGSAVGFLDDLARSRRVRVLGVTTTQEDEALRWLRRRDEREYSFVDATSFILMKALRIHDALAFDRDFTAAGFRQLQPD